MHHKIIIKHRILEKTQTLKNSLSIATQTPDYFANISIKKLYVWIILKEVVHVTKCARRKCLIQQRNFNKILSTRMPTFKQQEFKSENFRNSATHAHHILLHHWKSIAQNILRPTEATIRIRKNSTETNLRSTSVQQN